MESFQTILDQKSDEQFKFRTMENKDLTKEYFGLLSQLTDSPLPENEQEASKVLEEMQNSGIIIVVIEAIENNAIIGTGSLVLERKLIHGLCYQGHIEDIVVLEPFRGKGLGKKLIQTLCEIGRQKAGCYKVILNCSPENLGFYEKCGLAKAGQQCQMRF